MAVPPAPRQPRSVFQHAVTMSFGTRNKTHAGSAIRSVSTNRFVAGALILKAAGHVIRHAFVRILSAYAVLVLLRWLKASVSAVVGITSTRSVSRAMLVVGRVRVLI
jgi:hypothetical protein